MYGTGTLHKSKLLFLLPWVRQFAVEFFSSCLSKDISKKMTKKIHD